MLWFFIGLGIGLLVGYGCGKFVAALKATEWR